MSWFECLKVQSIDEFYDKEREEEENISQLKEKEKEFPNIMRDNRLGFGKIIEAIGFVVPIHEQYGMKDSKNKIRHLKWANTLKNYAHELKEFIKEQEG